MRVCLLLQSVTGSHSLWHHFLLCRNLEAKVENYHTSIARLEEDNQELARQMVGRLQHQCA